MAAARVLERVLSRRGAAPLARPAPHATSIAFGRRGSRTSHLSLFPVAVLLLAALLAALPLASAARLAAGTMVVVALGDSSDAGSGSRTTTVTLWELDVSGVPGGGAATARQSIPILSGSNSGGSTSTNDVIVTLTGSGQDTNR
jgi:HAMP domain-containing protein